MKIALVTETYRPEVNGVALTVQSLVHHLVGLGHGVVLSRPEHPEAGPPEDRLFVEQRLPGAPLPRYRSLRFGYPAAGRLASLWQALRVEGVYVATEGPLGYSAVSAARRLGIPVVTGFHTRFDVFVRHYGLPFLSDLAFAYLRHFHNRADQTLVPTGELRDFLRQRGFASVCLLPRAVDTDLFGQARCDPEHRARWQPDPRAPLLLAVGRLAPEKNFALAIRAYRAIAEGHPGTRLLIAGDGPARAELQASVPEACFVGMLPHHELRHCYAAADLFLMPSLTETFGNVTLEAMATGLPVVGFAYGAAREHVRDGVNGFLAPFGDEDAFLAASLAAMERIRAEPEPLREAARATVRSLSPTQVAADLADILVRLARGSAQPGLDAVLRG